MFIQHRQRPLKLEKGANNNPLLCHELTIKYIKRLLYNTHHNRVAVFQSNMQVVTMITALPKQLSLASAEQHVQLIPTKAIM